MEIVTIISLLLFTAFREVIHYMERKDMNDRLMSRNLPEYKVETQKKVKNEISEEEIPNNIELEDAKDEILKKYYA